MLKCPTGSTGLYRLHRASNTPPSIQVAIKNYLKKLFVISRLVIHVPKEPEEPEKSPRRCSHFIDTSSMRCDEVFNIILYWIRSQGNFHCVIYSKISALYVPQRLRPKRGLKELEVLII